LFFAVLTDDPSLLRCEIGGRTRIVAQKPVSVKGETLIAVSNTAVDSVGDQGEADSSREAIGRIEEILLIRGGLTISSSPAPAGEESGARSIINVRSAVDTRKLLTGHDKSPAPVRDVVVSAFGDQVKLLTSNRRITRLQSYRDQVESEVSCLEV